ncbi:cupredoxin domain-containing protein [Rhodococcus koreensis]|uniref:Cupredoxin-like domain-containing protein n=2 Tax=Rhodococcus koreensis TaxID=99653 RepID=A0A1H4M766_9NOCA|nr:cupredoxin domain-containing protein [Rhodococcus koreensis]SEB78940.1 Cupredoxin-like domain-containing protein [Rhodococcus koreensis]
MKLSAALPAAAVVAACALTACSDDGGSTVDYAPTPTVTDTMAMPSSDGAVAAGANEIVISGFAYTVPATVAPGAQVTIRNTDTAEHTVTADTGGTFDIEIEGGETATLTVPPTPGTYPFHCTYHSNMHGNLTVG